MPAPRFIDIRACPGLRSGGKRYLWRDIVKLRQQQREAARQGTQPPLFELRTDCRPPSDRTAAGRYREPTLFTQT